MPTLIPVVTASAAALAFGLAAVAEQRGTKRVRRRGALSPLLLLDLARQPLWLAGLGANVGGFALQVVALRTGPLALVEPILVVSLIVAAVTNAAVRKRWDAGLLAGVFACALGIAGFLAIARPSGGRASLGLPAALALGAGFAAILACCLALARRCPPARPLALALACGLDYGLAALLVKLVTAQFTGGLPEVLGRWPVYALAVIGPLGFLLNLNAFQQGTLLAPVLAVITAGDPLVSIGLAYLFLHEQFTGGTAGLTGTVASLLLMVAGIVVMSRRAPVVAQRLAGSPG